MSQNQTAVSVAEPALAETVSQRPPQRRRRLSVHGSPRGLGAVGAYAGIAVILFVFLFPLAFLLNTSLKSTAEFAANPVGIVADPQWTNFSEAWTRGNFGAYILNSLLYTVCGAALGTFAGLVMAFPVARGYVRGGGGWTALFTVMLFLPNALMTLFQLMLRINLYDTQLGYILACAAGVGVGPLLLLGFFRSLPRELDEAAAIDGIGYWRYLFTFVIPLAKPAIVTVFMLQAVWIWNEIILATILLPTQTKAPLPLGLLNFQGTYSNQWGLLAAATVIVAAPLIVAYIFIQRYLVNGVLGGAVKG